MKQGLLTILLLGVILMVPGTLLCSSVTRITAVMSSDQPRYREAHRAFVKSISVHGFKLPTTEITLLVPLTDQALASDIRKLSNSHADLIVTYGAPASLAAVREVVGTPVVSVDVFAPEQPIKGMCGVSSRVSMASLLKTFQTIHPFQHLGVLYSPREFGSQQQLEDIKKNAVKLGITVIEGSVTSAGALEGELNKLLDKCEAVVVTEAGLFGQQFEYISARSRARRIPIAATMPDAAEKGAVVSLEVNPQEQGYIASEMAVRVLEGAKTEFLPLVRPQRIDLVINMRRAREMGIVVPFSVLQGANRLIR